METFLLLLQLLAELSLISTLEITLSIFVGYLFSTKQFNKA